jgi:hypothetical protein
MKVYEGVEVEFHAFIDGYECSASHLGCFTRYPLSIRMGGTWSKSACSGDKKTLALQATDAQLLGCPALNLVNIPSELLQLSRHCHFEPSPEYTYSIICKNCENNPLRI